MSFLRDARSAKQRYKWISAMPYPVIRVHNTATAPMLVDVFGIHLDMKKQNGRNLNKTFRKGLLNDNYVVGFSFKEGDPGFDCFSL